MRLVWSLLAVTACSGISSEPPEAEVVASALLQPAGLALGGDDVYFVSAATGNYQIVRVPKQGGGLQIHHATSVIHAIAADTSGVYWVQNNGYVMTSAPGVTMATQLGRGTEGTNGYTLRNLAVDDQAVYHADVTGTVWKTWKNGSGSVELGKTDTAVGSVAVSLSGVWVATTHGAKRFPVTGGAAMDLTFSQQPPDALAWAGDTLFALFGGSGSADGAIVRVFKDGTATTLVDNLVLPSSLVASGSNLYVTTGNHDSAIRRVPQVGGAAELLATSRHPADVAVDADFVYWSDPELGEIRRVPR